MSYYNVGLQTSPRRSLYNVGMNSSVQVGLLPGFVGTDEALRELNLLNGEVLSADEEIKSFPGDSSFSIWREGPWKTFLGRWKSFYSDNKGYWARFWSPKDIFIKTQYFRSQYIALRTIANSLKMEWTSPEPKSPEKPPSIMDDLSTSIGLDKLFKYMVFGILLIGGSILLLTFLR